MKCWKTGKVEFQTQRGCEQRMTELNEFNELNDRNWRVKTAYLCEHCNKWHMTKLSVKDYNRIQKVENKNKIKPTVAEEIADRMEYLRTKPGMKNK